MPGPVALDLLTGALGSQLRTLLARVPTEVPLEHAPAALVTDDSPVGAAWRLLTAQHGVNWVIAGKLLARKRPHLIPVYDNVTRCVLDRPDGHVWERFRAELQHDDLAARLAALRTAADLPSSISSLRVLDVLLWRSHHEQHRRECR